MGMIGNAPQFGVVDTVQIRDSAVTTAKVADSAVTNAKVAANAVTLDKLSRTGTAGQILVSGGPSADPSYQNNPPAFASGTSLVFVQTTAPTGWTKSTTHNDKALRIVNGTVGSGGTTSFSSVFTSRTPEGSVSVSGSVGSTTLDSSQMPSHRHWTGSYYMDDFNGNNGYLGVQDGDNYYSALYTDYQGGSGAHNHSFSGSGSFTGTAMDFAVQYVDAIIATKD